MDIALLYTHWFIVLCFPVCMAYAGFCDLRGLIIPNKISIIIALLFLPAALLAGLGFQEIAINYGAGFLLFSAGAVLFAFRFLGGGDVKIIAAAGIWVGWENLTAFLILIALSGGFLALLIVIFKRIGCIPHFMSTLPWLSAETGKGQPVPYGVAIGIAALLGFHRFSVLPNPLY